MLTFTNEEVQGLQEQIRKASREMRHSMELAASHEHPSTRRALLEINFQQVDLRVEMAFNRAKMERTGRELARRDREDNRRQNNRREQPRNFAHAR